ncbi:MAG: glycosyltransferase [Candidatus Saccharibacteria bacterium]|nr:glycosyltransferase [Candidatus Saccharibacteria bacterium]
MTKSRIALVMDWLDTVGGAERVLLALHELYPDAPIYTSHYDEKGIDWFKDAEVHSGFLQIFPTPLRRFLGPLRQLYFSHLDLTNYDLVISVTGAEAKSIKAKNHLCYCHVPTQYYWGMYDDYLKNPGFGPLDPVVRFFLKLLVRPLRRADLRAAKGPTKFITISSYAQKEIKKYYDRESLIIHPPVNTKIFSTTTVENSILQHNKTGNCQIKKSEHKHNKTEKSQVKVHPSMSFSEHKQHKMKKSQIDPDSALASDSSPLNFITTARQVTWKRLDLCVEACLKTGDNLTLIGEGPEHKNLVKLADGAENIHFLPKMSQSELVSHLRNSDAYLFPSKEPFGIAPIEALAAGCPVIAYKNGGSLDYINDKNGVFFAHQSVNSLAKALKIFRQKQFNPEEVTASAEKFDKKYFTEKISALVTETLESSGSHKEKK